MVHDATYSSKYDISCNKISIDLLKSLDKFLLEKEIIPQNILNSHVFFCYENCTIHAVSLSELFDKEHFILNFDKDFSISLTCYECELKSSIYLSINKTKEKITFNGTLQNSEEHIAIGHKEVLEKFLKDNFIEEKVVEQERNDNDKQAENKTAIKTLEKKSLEWDIPSVKLTLEDLTEIEFILKQDLTDIEEYEINIEPNKKYLQKRTNAPKYTFNSVSQFQDYDDLVKNIKNYSIKFELRTAEISVNFGFSNEYSYLNKLYAYGGNQTLYYGKYKLLTDYLNIKKSWYAYIYNDKFLAIIFPVCSLLVAFWATYMGICISSKSWIKLILLLICAITFTLLLIFTPKILIKYNLKLQKNNKFWESSYFQIFAFIVSTLISIISIIIPIIIK